MTTSIETTERETTVKEPNPVWHRRLAQGYLLGCALAAVVFVLALIPAMPLFIKLLMPFPKLEDATHWVGRVEVEGEFRIGLKGNTIPRMFIITSAGRHEFKCGYMGHRIACPHYELLHGATGEVWYHPIFGDLQSKFVFQEGKFKGEVAESPISSLERYHHNRFSYKRYLEKLSIALVVLATGLWQYRRYRLHSAAAVAAEKSSTTTVNNAGK